MNKKFTYPDPCYLSPDLNKTYEYQINNLEELKIIIQKKIYDETHKQDNGILEQGFNAS